MANRSVIVRLEAQVGGYVAGFGKAATATEDVTKKTAQAKKSIAENKQAMQDAGQAYLGFGAVTVAALGASAKAAMDWESAWTGVLKTVDGTPEQLDAVESGLRGLAKTLPASHAEIAAVAEAAGQLGIETGNVVAFTKTMIDMGESTNLSAEEAATSLSRFMNVMGTAQGDVGRLGAAIVGLGNNYATTEAEILALAMRLSGAGKQANLSEGQVLGLAAAMSSVGIEAEAGGSAMSLTMKRIEKSVGAGDDALSLFATTAGMTSEEFATAWQQDAGGALEAFVLGLGKAGEEGESVNGILRELGITGIREADALLRLSSAGELMGDAMRRGGEEVEKGTALAEEAAKRYETTESKIKIAWNGIKDAAIDAGAVLLPVIQGVAESVGGIAAAFGALPAPVQGAVTVFAGITGGAALLAGGLLTTLPKIMETREAFRTLNASGSKIPGTLGKVGKAAGVAAGAMAALGIAGASINAMRDSGVPTIQEMTNELLKMGKAGSVASLDEMVARTGFLSTSIEGIGDAVNYVGSLNGFDKFTMSVSGSFGLPSHMQDIADSVGSVDASLGQLVQGGNTADAAAAFQQIATEATAQGMEIGDVLDIFPQYKEQLIATAIAAGGTATDQEILNAALGNADPAAVTAAAAQEIMASAVEETGVAIDGTIEKMDEFLEQLFAAGILTMDSRDAQVAYQEQLRGVDDAVQKIIDSEGKMGRTLNKSKTDFDLATEAGALANDTFQGLARKGMAEVEAMAAEGLGQDKLQEKLSDTYNDLLATADAFGLDEQKAKDLAREILGVPDGVKVKSWMSKEAKRVAEDTNAELDTLDGRTVNIWTKHHVQKFEEAGVPVGFYQRAPSAPKNGKATGGAINGPGSGTSDTAGLFALSNGEHVLTASEVQAMGGQSSVYRFRQQLKSGVRGYAEGGAVGTMYAPPPTVNVSGGGGPRIDLGGITINGATDENRVARKVTDEITNKLGRVGVRIG